jgi:hypothetical protein
MFVQSMLAWIVLGAGVMLTVVGLLGGVFGQPLWTGPGALKLVLFTAGYTALAGITARYRPRVFPLALGGLAVGYSMLAVGPVAVLGAAWLLVGAYATGAWILQTRLKFLAKYPQAVALLGLAIWSVFMCFTASRAIHYWWVYSLVFVIPVFQLFRLRLVQNVMPALPETGQGTLWGAVAIFPAAVNWMVALKPEVSADGLSIHLPLASRMAARHSWPFDGAEFSWAVKPMNGDWVWSIAYLLGGEGAAKLINALVLVLICWLLYTWLHELVPARLAALLTAGYASTPLVMRVTGSMDVENVAAAFILAALIYYRRYLKAQKLADALAMAVLAGAAAATSLSSVAILIPFVLAALLTLQLRHAFYAGALGLAIGAEPYLTAATRTGNPILPYMNHYFRSPLFDTATPLADPSLATTFDWRSWFDITFHTSRFGDGGDGSFGILFFVLAPLALAAVRSTWPRIGLAALWTSLIGALIVLLSVPDIRHLYPALPMLTLACGVAVAMLRAHSQRLEWGVSAWCVASILVHLALLPVAAPQHAGFFLTPGFDRKGVEEYLARYAPERPLVDHLNQIAPNGRAAWMESDAVANLTGRSFANTRHNYAFWKALRTSTAAEGHLYQAGQNQIEYFIAPAAVSQRAMSSVFTREFLDLYTDPVRRFADFELRKLTPERRTLDGVPQPYAPPGRYDELNSFVRYEGQWGRDVNSAHAYLRTLAYTNDARSRVHIRFQGRALTLIHTAAANRCSVLITLDGGESVALSQFSEKARWQARPARFEAPPGYHSLVLRFPQPKEGTSSTLGCFADLDGFIVE